MIDSRIFINIGMIILLVFLQVFIFSNINFGGTINPYIYLIFILVYPPNRNPYVFLMACFLLGLGVDIFENTGGINAFASVFIGFIRNNIIRNLAGKVGFEIDEFSFAEFNMFQWLIYAAILIVIHHFLIFFLESFTFENIWETFMKALLSSLFTLIITLFYLLLFRKRAEI